MVTRVAQCKTCMHRDRGRIEFMLSNGVAAATVGRQFDLNHMSIWRHFKSHVTQQKKDSLRLVGTSDPKVDLEALKQIESETLLQNLVIERARLQRIADACESVGNYQDATRASTALVRVLELAAKYLGELNVGNTTITNNFLLSPDWVDLRRVIVSALRSHPEARQAVLSAVQRHESLQGAKPVLEHHA